MALILAAGIDLTNPTGFAIASSTNRTPAGFSYVSADGMALEVAGQNLTYDGNGIPNGGVVTAIAVSGAVLALFVGEADAKQLFADGAANFFEVLAARNDEILGGEGDDTFFGTKGSDLIKGAGGQDSLDWRPGQGADGFDGGNGFDVLNVTIRNGFTTRDDEEGNFAIGKFDPDGTMRVGVAVTEVEKVNIHVDNAGKGPKTFILASDAAINVDFFGSEQADHVDARNFDGLSEMYGHGGDDRLVGDVDDTTNLFGGDGNDTLIGGQDGESIHGGAGNDLIRARGGSFEQIRGDGGADTIFGGAGSDQISGGGGADVLFGDGGKDALFGGGGNDFLQGGKGADELYGGAGADTIRGGKGADYLGYDDQPVNLGGVTVNLGTGVAKGGWAEGDDFAAIEHVGGTRANDRIVGDGGNNMLVGGVGNDTLNGGEGADTLIAQDGDDRLVGGAGADFLMGDSGSDVLTGGEGADTFHFSKFVVGFGEDTITDYEIGVDTILIEGFKEPGVVSVTVHDDEGNALIAIDYLEDGEGFDDWVLVLNATAAQIAAELGL